MATWVVATWVATTRVTSIGITNIWVMPPQADDPIKLIRGIPRSGNMRWRNESHRRRLSRPWTPREWIMRQ